MGNDTKQIGEEKTTFVFMKTAFEQIPKNKLMPVVDGIYSKAEKRILTAWMSHYMKQKVPFAIVSKTVKRNGRLMVGQQLWKERRAEDSK